jgi:hypothetical protein
MTIKAQATIVEDWNMGYKLETELESDTDVQSWSMNLDLGSGHTITAAYGADLTELGDGKYSISGQGGQSDLSQGQVIKPIFIVDDGGGQTVTPKFTGDALSPLLAPDALEVQGSVNEAEESQSQTDSSQVSTTLTIGSESAINVDRDFDGDLDKAIAAAQDGDTVQLGDSVYKTLGFAIDKNLILEGTGSSVIDGQGTDSSVITLTDNADETIIRNLDITNGNNGISGDRANNVTLENLNIYDIGFDRPITDGSNNIGINLSHANGLQLLNSRIDDVGRKGVGLGDTDGATIKGLNVSNVNLTAQHSQSHDAAGIKLFNTNNVTISDNKLHDINANFIWNDTTNSTQIKNNTIVNVGEDFIAPSFNAETDINGIYNEKSSNATVSQNNGTSVGDFATFNATEFATDSTSLNDNSFATVEVDTEDYWVNAGAEKLVALTEDPDQANFELFAQDYYASAYIG